MAIAGAEPKEFQFHPETKEAGLKGEWGLELKLFVEEVGFDVQISRFSNQVFIGRNPSCGVQAWSLTLRGWHSCWGKHFMQLLTTLSDTWSDCLWKVCLSDLWRCGLHIFNSRCPRSHLKRKNSAATCDWSGGISWPPSRWQEATGIQVCMSHLDRIMQASDKHVSSLHFRIYRDDQQRFFVEARYSWSGWYSMNLTIWRSAFSHRNVDIQSSNLPLIVYKTGRKEIEAHSYLAPVYHCEREIEGVEFFWVLHQQPTGEVAWQNPDIGNSSQCQDYAKEKRASCTTTWSGYQRCWRWDFPNEIMLSEGKCQGPAFSLAPEVDAFDFDKEEQNFGETWFSWQKTTDILQFYSIQTLSWWAIARLHSKI